MPLAIFTLFLYGILSEIALLYEAARPPVSAGLPVSGAPPPLGAPPIMARVFSPARALVMLMGPVAAALVGLFALLGIDQVKVYIDTPGINFIFYGLGFFVLAAAFVGVTFLPPVNEQSILAVQALILLNALAGGVVDWIPMAALTAVPALVCLGLLVWPRSFAPEVKAVLYLWYLLSLLAMPFQSGQAAYFRAPLLTWFEAWVFGGLFIFMILHGLFAVRFFLLASSLILPRNRPAIAPLMARLFSDEQASLPRFALVMALSAGLVLFNKAAGLVAQPVMLGLCVMIVTQVLGRRF